MSYLRPGEIAPHDGYYITRGCTVFLRQGQEMPNIRLEGPELETELNKSLLKDIDEQG